VFFGIPQTVKCGGAKLGYYMHKFITNKMKKELSFSLFKFKCFDFFPLEVRPVSGVEHTFKCPLKERGFLPMQ
jgi:hypothetical protein